LVVAVTALPRSGEKGKRRKKAVEKLKAAIGSIGLTPVPQV
jgi:hypothetical protein